MTTPTLLGIDHFHLYVSSKKKAVAWYSSILGFETCKSFELWDTDDGPLTIVDRSGTIHLALFRRKLQPPSTSIAFKVTGEEFLRWERHLLNNDLKLRLADHQITWSLYFKDPDENMHEITTYDHEVVANKIGSRGENVE